MSLNHWLKLVVDKYYGVEITNWEEMILQALCDAGIDASSEQVKILSEIIQYRVISNVDEIYQDAIDVRENNEQI